MLKVSFKEDYKKIQTFNNRVTVVTFIGEMKLPHELWMVVPKNISSWLWYHQAIDVSWGHCTKDLEVFRLEFSGKSVCAEEDTFNAVTGQRIAESRAKIKLYKFVHNLCESLMKYYYGIMYGNAEFDVIRESHVEAPKDCLYLTCKKYRELWIKEFHHLEELLKKA